MWNGSDVLKSIHWIFALLYSELFAMCYWVNLAVDIVIKNAQKMELRSMWKKIIKQL